MKLARAVINEVLNSSNISMTQKSVNDRTEMDGYYCIDQRRPNTTKVVVPFKLDKGGSYRPIEVKTTERLSAANIMVFGNNTATNYFLGGYLEDELVKSANAFHAQYSFRGNAKAVKLPSIKIVKDHGWMTKEKFYMWLIKQGVADIIIRTYFPEMATVNVEDATVKHGNLTLVGFDEKEHKKLIDIFDKSEKVLKKAGFNDLCYGKVYLVPKDKKSSNVLADYIERDDSIRVFDSATAEKNKLNEPVKTFVHELGHRYYYKKISSTGRRLIGQEYIKHLSGAEKEAQKKRAELVKKHGEYKVGDRVTHHKHGELEYGGIRSIGWSPKFLFHPVDNGNVLKNKYLSFGSMEEAVEYFAKAKEPKATKTSIFSGNPWMPTNYSRKDSVEWFAEVFAYAVSDDNDEILKWIKDLK